MKQLKLQKQQEGKQILVSNIFLSDSRMSNSKPQKTFTLFPNYFLSLSLTFPFEFPRETLPGRLDLGAFFFFPHKAPPSPINPEERPRALSRPALRVFGSGKARVKVGVFSSDFGFDCVSGEAHGEKPQLPMPLVSILVNFSVVFEGPKNFETIYTNVLGRT